MAASLTGQGMMTTRQVAAALGIHYNTVKNLGDRGALHFVRVSTRGDRRYDPDDVAAYLDRMTARFASKSQPVGGGA